MPDHSSRRLMRQLREHLALLPYIEKEISQIEQAERINRNYQEDIEAVLKKARLNSERNRIRLILAQMKCREASLFFEEGKSLYEISELYDKSYTTINTRINRAIKAYLQQQHP